MVDIIFVSGSLFSFLGSLLLFFAAKKFNEEIIFAHSAIDHNQNVLMNMMSRGGTGVIFGGTGTRVEKQAKRNSLSSIASFFMLSLGNFLTLLSWIIERFM